MLGLMNALKTVRFDQASVAMNSASRSIVPPIGSPLSLTISIATMEMARSATSAELRDSTHRTAVGWVSRLPIWMAMTGSTFSWPTTVHRIFCFGT